MDACASCGTAVPVNEGPWCWWCLGPLCGRCAPLAGCARHPSPVASALAEVPAPGEVRPEDRSRS